MRNEDPPNLGQSEPWMTQIALEANYVDYLGHVTAFRYLELFETAHARWLSAIMRVAAPAFVVADVRIRFVRELLIVDGPVEVSVSPTRMTRSSVSVAEELRSTTGVLHSRACAVLVKWDPKARQSLPFTRVERFRVEEQVLSNVIADGPAQNLHPPAGHHQHISISDAGDLS